MQSIVPDGTNSAPTHAAVTDLERDAGFCHEAPNSAHTSRLRRIHEIAAEFQVADVSALQAPGGPDDFSRLVAGIASGDLSRGSSLSARTLWAIRRKVGGLLGWDDTEAGLGSRAPTGRDRLPRDLRATVGPDFNGLPFAPLYAEIANIGGIMTPDTASVVTFAAASALTPFEPGRFGAMVSPEWTIAGKPNGGYLLSMLGRAAASVSAHPDVIAASAHFLRTPDPIGATIETEALRQGRSASQIRARLLQDDKVCVEALVIVADLGKTTPAHWDDGLPSIGNVAYDDCERLPARAPNGARVNLMGQVEVRLEPSSCGFIVGHPSGLGELRGWLALPDGAPFDPVSLLFAVDSFPPATFDIELTGWVPTLELTAYVRARPAPGPVRVLQRVQLIAGGRFDEACFIWDSTGRLVAQSTQLAAIRVRKMRTEPTVGEIVLLLQETDALTEGSPSTRGASPSPQEPLDPEPPSGVDQGGDRGPPHRGGPISLS